MTLYTKNIQNFNYQTFSFSEKTKEEEVDTEQVELLEKLKAKHKDSNVGSLQANDRLMKELRQIYKSAAYKSGEFAIGSIKEL